MIVNIMYKGSIKLCIAHLCVLSIFIDSNSNLSQFLKVMKTDKLIYNLETHI